MNLVVRSTDVAGHEHVELTLLGERIMLPKGVRHMTINVTGVGSVRVRSWAWSGNSLVEEEGDLRLTAPEEMHVSFGPEPSAAIQIDAVAPRVEEGLPSVALSPEQLEDVYESVRLGEVVEFDYTNYKGEFARRRVVPLGVRWDQAKGHDGPAWLLRAWCLDRKAVRDFEISKINKEPK